MIVTPNIRKKYHAAFKKARSERIRAVRLAADLWYCARVASGHGRYLIRFNVIPSVRGEDQVTVECRSVDGEPCKGCWKDRMCVHIATCIDRGIQYGKRKQVIESEAA